MKKFFSLQLSVFRAGGYFEIKINMLLLSTDN